MVSDTALFPVAPISFRESPGCSFQQTLNQLDSALTPTDPLYLVLRGDDSLLTAITYVPYRADARLKALLLDGRVTLIKSLGESYFHSSIICKEIGEITDIRSWDERRTKHMHKDHGEGIQVHGHEKNKCRLCDRRMKNRIEDDALAALRDLSENGSCAQIVCNRSLLGLLLKHDQFVNTHTESLQLNFTSKALPASTVPSRLPTSTPSFTFYRHDTNNRLYFIYCSPDSATVQERMKHTLAIPGLINIIARDNGIDVDQKIEIHEPEDLDFTMEDKRVGKFRSMYLRNDFVGTESQWEGMEDSQRLLDTVSQTH